LVVLCLVLASVAHAKESGKPSNCQTSGSADSCPVSEKTLLTRRARNIQEGLALEEARTSLIGKGEAQATLEDAKADLAGLIEQEDGDEGPNWKNLKRKSKQRMRKTRGNVRARFEAAKAKKEKLVNKAQTKNKEIKEKLDANGRRRRYTNAGGRKQKHAGGRRRTTGRRRRTLKDADIRRRTPTEKLGDAKAKFDDARDKARDKGAELRAKAKAAKAAFAGLIEQEDGDERKKWKKFKDEVSGVED